MFYYSKKEGSAIADMNCYDYSTVSANVLFDEMVVTEVEDAYYLCIHAQQFTGCKKSKDDTWKFEPNQKVRIKINRKEYKKRDFRTKVEETRQPSQFERVVCKLIETGIWNIKDHCFYGDMQIGENSATASILTGQDVFGNNLPPEQVKRNIDRVFGIQAKPKSEKKHFTDEELESAAAAGGFVSKGFSGGVKSQTEFEKLSDRFRFLQEHLKAKYPALNVETIYDISPYGIVEQPIAENLKLNVESTVAFYLNFIHGQRTSG